MLSGCDREHLSVPCPRAGIGLGFAASLWLWMEFWEEKQSQPWYCCLTSLTVQFQPLAAKFPELFQEMSIL